MPAFRPGSPRPRDRSIGGLQSQRSLFDLRIRPRRTVLRRRHRTRVRGGDPFFRPIKRAAVSAEQAVAGVLRDVLRSGGGRRAAERHVRRRTGTVPETNPKPEKRASVRFRKTLKNYIDYYNDRRIVNKQKTSPVKYRTCS